MSWLYTVNFPLESGHSRYQRAQEMDEKPKRRSKSFATVGNVLNTVVSKLGLDRRLREKTLINLWPAIVGETFARRSRAIFINYEGNLVVAVKDASTGQELSLSRQELSSRLRAAAGGLGLDTKGIRFDLKHYHSADNRDELASIAAISKQPARKEPAAEELNSISLSSEDLEALQKLELELQSAHEAPSEALGETSCQTSPGRFELRQRILALYERELRLKRWMTANQYPICSSCAEPTPLLHGSQSVCAACYLKLFKASS